MFTLAKLSNKPVFAFLIGVLSMFPSILPSILSIMKKPELKQYRLVSLETKIYQMAIFYGILHVILFFLINKFLPEKYQNYLTLGIIIGLIYPTLGTVTGYAKRTYNITSTPKLYISAMILYLFTYVIVFNNIAKNIC